MEGVQRGGRAAFQRAQEADDVIDLKDADDLDPHPVTGDMKDPVRFSEDLYLVLAGHVENEALDIVMSIPRGQGLEAWRSITKRFDGSGPNRRRQALRQILRPDSHKVQTLGGSCRSVGRISENLRAAHWQGV